MTGRAVLLAAAAAVGVALIVMGVGGSGRAAFVFPARFEPGSESFEQMLGVLDRLHRAVTRGDIDRLSSDTTPRFLEEVQQRIQDLGGERLDGMSLHEQAGFIGDVRLLRPLVGRGDGSRAVVVLALGESELGGRALCGFVFEAGANNAPQLDGRFVRSLDPDDLLLPAASAWAGELLAASASGR